MSTVKRENTSDSSTSESEVSACSSNYNPIKALYSDKVKVPVESAPLYENIAQFEAALVQQEIIPVGKTELVQQREEEKERKRVEEEKRLEEKNKQRFAQYKGRGEVTLGRAFNARGSMSTAADEPAPRSSCRAYPLDKLRSPPKQFDFEYLKIKVALIFGVNGACRGNELVNIKIEDIEKHPDLLLVNLPHTKSKKGLSFVVRGEYVRIIEKYQALRPSNINTNRFFIAYNNGLEPKKKEFKVRNVLTRMEAMEGPLEMLQVWVEKRLRVQIITRNDRGVRGVLHATVVAFDKHWNLALSDVLEIWYKKVIKKRKTPPAMGTPVPKGTAATIFPVPEVNECLIRKGLMECMRQIPQMMVRGEHIVLVHVSQR